jgi:hypothetical protein
MLFCYGTISSLTSATNVSTNWVFHNYFWTLWDERDWSVIDEYCICSFQWRLRNSVQIVVNTELTEYIIIKQCSCIARYLNRFAYASIRLAVNGNTAAKHVTCPFAGSAAPRCLKHGCQRVLSHLHALCERCALLHRQQFAFNKKFANHLCKMRRFVTMFTRCPI